MSRSLSLSLSLFLSFFLSCSLLCRFFFALASFPVLASLDSWRSCVFRKEGLGRGRGGVSRAHACCSSLFFFCRSLSFSGGRFCTDDPRDCEGAILRAEAGRGLFLSAVLLWGEWWGEGEGVCSREQRRERQKSRERAEHGGGDASGRRNTRGKSGGGPDHHATLSPARATSKRRKVHLNQQQHQRLPALLDSLASQEQDRQDRQAKTANSHDRSPCTTAPQLRRQRAGQQHERKQQADRLLRAQAILDELIRQWPRPRRDARSRRRGQHQPVSGSASAALHSVQLYHGWLVGTLTHTCARTSRHPLPILSISEHLTRTRVQQQQQQGQESGGDDVKGEETESKSQVACSGDQWMTKVCLPFLTPFPSLSPPFSDPSSSSATSLRRPTGHADRARRRDPEQLRAQGHYHHHYQHCQ